MIERVECLLKEKKNLEKKLKHRPTQVSGSDLFEEAETVGDHKILIKKVSTNGLDELKVLGDHVFNTLSRGIAVLFSEGEEKPSAVIVVSKDLNETGVLAGALAKEIGGVMGGGGGGKPHLATAGGRKNDAIQDAMGHTKALIIQTLSG